MENQEIIDKLLNDRELMDLLAMCNRIVNKAYNVNSKSMSTIASDSAFSADCASFSAALKTKGIDVTLSCYDLYMEIIHPVVMAEIRRGM